jgi:hypothetical protein
VANSTTETVKIFNTLQDGVKPRSIVGSIAVLVQRDHLGGIFSQGIRFRSSGSCHVGLNKMAWNFHLTEWHWAGHIA